MLLVDRGQTEQGLALLERADVGAASLASDAARASIRFRLAVSLSRSGQVQEARKLLGELLGRETDFPERETAIRLKTQLELL